MDQLNEPGRCASCVYWEPATDWYDLYSPSDGYEIEDNDPERWAQIQQHNREAGKCQKIVEGWGDDDKTKPLPLATCWDGSQYAATLRTHRDFGCILHKPKAEDRLRV